MWIRFWASPQGAPKAAIAGTTDTFWLGANPGTLFDDGKAKVGQTSVAWEGGKPVITFPLPGVPGPRVGLLGVRRRGPDLALR